MIRFFSASTPSPAHKPTVPPTTDEQLRLLEAANEKKRQEAIAFLGRRWLLHPVNRIR